MKQLLLTVGILFFISLSQNIAQNGAGSATSSPATTINFTHTLSRNNLSEFKLRMPSIRNITSAQPPHYSYYIDYGDGYVDFGHFNDFEDTLSLYHRYNGVPNKDVMCRVYDNYGNGTPPPPAKIIRTSLGITTAGTAIRHNSILPPSGNSGVKIQPTFYPKRHGIDGPFSIQPEDDLALILAYKNNDEESTSGQLVLIYNQNNEEQFAVNSQNIYHNESRMPASAIRNVAALGNNINLNNADFLVWEVANLPVNEEYQIIVDLNVLPEITAEESVLRLVFIPNNSSQSAATWNDEVLLSIIDERDPNKMKGKLNKKLFKKSDYDYTIQFFNEGDGPVTDITLEIKEFNANWNSDQLEVTGMKIAGQEVKKEEIVNKYALSLQDNVMIMALKEVRLEGLNSDDLEKVEHAYATIDFTIKPKKDWKTTKAQTSIIFSDKEPVKTNMVRIFPDNRYFLGVETGYTYDFSDLDTLIKDEDLLVRGVTGWRFTDRISALVEFGVMPSSELIKEDVLINRQSYFLNPQVVFRLNRWWKVATGFSAVRQNESRYAYFTDEFISSSQNDSFRFLVDTHITPIQNRVFAVNIGARHYKPFNNVYNSSSQIYATFKLNILE